MPDTSTVVQGILNSTVAEATVRASTALERDQVQDGIRSSEAEVDSAGTWTDLPGATQPTVFGSFSVAFDDGQNVPSGLPDSFGTRAAVVTVSSTDPSELVGGVALLSGASVVCTLPSSIVNAEQLLAAVGEDLTCPAQTVAPVGSSITSMWAWGNSVDPSVDNRGLNEPGMTPEAIASFASEHGLTSVYLSTPWAADQGAIETWLSDTVDALHADGISVSALGGDSSWLDNPSLVAEWVTDARAAADFDAIELDVEPWAGVSNPDFGTITPAYVTLLNSAKAAAGPLPLGADLPWWLASTSYGSGTVFSALLPSLDTVAIVAFSDHVSGSDGIDALAGPAASQASVAGKPFTIGVETDTPAVAGGAQYTFYGDTESELEAATAQVGEAYQNTPGFGGVTVEHMLSWEALEQ